MTFFPLDLGHKGEEVGRLGPTFGLQWNFWSLYADEKFLHTRYSAVRALVRPRARLAAGFSRNSAAR